MGTASEKDYGNLNIFEDETVIPDTNLMVPLMLRLTHRMLLEKFFKKISRDCESVV